MQAGLWTADGGAGQERAGGGGSRRTVPEGFLEVVSGAGGRGSGGAQPRWAAARHSPRWGRRELSLQTCHLRPPRPRLLRPGARSPPPAWALMSLPVAAPSPPCPGPGASEGQRRDILASPAAQAGPGRRPGVVDGRSDRSVGVWGLHTRRGAGVAVCADRVCWGSRGDQGPPGEWTGPSEGTPHSPVPGEGGVTAEPLGLQGGRRDSASQTQTGDGGRAQAHAAGLRTRLYLGAAPGRHASPR